jgi:hypothetical protein
MGGKTKSFSPVWGLQKGPWTFSADPNYLPLSLDDTSIFQKIGFACHAGQTKKRTGHFIRFSLLYNVAMLHSLFLGF